jgi:multiple sugar transport system ATP-binding protein
MLGASLEIHDVRKAFGTKPVIRGQRRCRGRRVRYSGWTVGLRAVGPASDVADREMVTDGKIRIGPRIANNVAPKDRDISMVFQNYAPPAIITSLVALEGATSAAFAERPDRTDRTVS